ncbi:uncharacterized protein METZ01_LOCUS107053 [marine metagenome]|uniref:UDP-MurNAc-pentapeptide synthetase n=1 Tax=marine metagenome TaxID=408172 RepID=A0A381WNT3_9ZZZZ
MAGDLYIALKGKRTDGHTFLSSVKKAGAAAALVEYPDPSVDLQQIKVDDPQTMIGKIAHTWREQFDIPVIGITGSNGKTSTKELLLHVLSNQYDVHATEGNFNTSIGLPLTLLLLDKTNTISILEMGANQVGDIEYLCNIANPTHGLITNIAPAHLSRFGTIDAIAKTKGALFQSLENGTSFMNYADERIANMQIPGEKVTYGLNADCDFPVDIHHENDGSLTLTIDTHEIRTGSQNLSYARNTLAVAAIAVTLGIDWNDLQEKILSFSPPPGRCQIKQYNSITVIDDTYNANLESSLAALDYLKAFSGNGRRVFVFGDMFELGESSQQQHEKVGHKCSESELDAVYTIGDESIITNSVLQNVPVQAHFRIPDELITTLRNDLHNGDKVLFKGSRGMAMERIIEGVFLN